MKATARAPRRHRADRPRRRSSSASPSAARADRRGPAAGGDAARAARPRRAARHLADAGPPSRSSRSSARASSRSPTTGRALVSRLTREDLEELYAARLGLEGLAARARRGGGRTAGARADARPARASSTGSRGRRTSTATSTRRWELPRDRYLASGRTRLVAEVERLFWRGERYNRLVLSTAERFERSVGYYRDFLDACEARDPDGAERVIHESDAWAVDLIGPSLPSEQRAVSADRRRRRRHVHRRVCVGDGRRASVHARCSRRRRPTTAPSSTPSRELAAGARGRRASSTARPSRRTPCSSAAARGRRSSRPRASATCSSCGGCACRTSTTTSGRSRRRSSRAASASRSPSA